MGVTPQERVAAMFMANKGYPNAQPVDVEKLDGQPVWYFSYDLDEGLLEIEISWNERTQEWESLVTTFSVD